MADAPTSPAPPAAVLRDGTGAWRRLVAANVGVIGLIALLVTLTLHDSRQAHRRRAFDVAETLARGVEQAIEAEISHADLALRRLLTADPGERTEVIARLRDLAPEAERLRVLPAAALPPTLQEAVRGAAPGRPFVAGPRKAGDRWVLDVGRPLPPGTAGAEIAVAEIDTARFEQLFARLALRGQTAVALRMADLALVARHPQPPNTGVSIGTQQVSAELTAALARAPLGGTYLAATVLDGIERANAYRRIEGLPMIVLVGIGDTDQLDTWRREARLAVALAALGSAMLVGGSIAGWRAWSRRQAARQALERERERLRALLAAASDAIHVLDRNGRLVEFSDAFAALLGRPREALQGAHVGDWEIAHPPAQVDRTLHSFRIGQRLNFDSVFRRADGSSVAVEVACVGVRVDGRDLFYLSARDVTERQRSLDALKASESFLDRTGRIAGVAGWEVDLASGRLHLTAHGARLLDIADPVRPAVRDCLRALSRADRHRLLRAAARASADGQPWDLEFAARTATGRTVWLRCFGEPVRDGAGRTRRLTGAVQDVTERRTRTAELQREQGLRAELERQGREQQRMLLERGEMLDVMAHEVRQPLNNASAALQSAASALREVDEPAASQRLLRAQNVLGQVMARIDNTLAVAALLARPGPIDRAETDIDTLVAVAAADMPANERVRVELRRETSARSMPMDMSLMRLALRNLLSNALKYSPPGSPVVLRLADSELPPGLVMDVIDQGGGVPDALRSRLFERGARGSSSGSGHGLGLYIVRRVMELHGGQAALVESGEGGTTMRLVVPDTPGD